MSLVRCPHCGRLNFMAGGWADLDRCARCGKSLAKQDPRAASGWVQERMSTRAFAGARSSGRESTEKEETQ